MRKPIIQKFETFNVNQSEEGQTIEEELRKITAEKEQIGSKFPMIYTDKKDGVLPAYNIRSDRFEIAREAKEKIGQAEAQKIAKRESKPGSESKEDSVSAD